MFCSPVKCNLVLCQSNWKLSIPLSLSLSASALFVFCPGWWLWLLLRTKSERKITSQGRRVFERCICHKAQAHYLFTTWIVKTEMQNSKKKDGQQQRTPSPSWEKERERETVEKRIEGKPKRRQLEWDVIVSVVSSIFTVFCGFHFKWQHSAAV